MLLFLLNHKLLSGLIWLSIVCGVSVQIIMGVCMQRFVEEMDQISVSKNSFLNMYKICPEGTSPGKHVDNMMENCALLHAKVYLPRRGTLLKVNNGNDQPTWRGNSKGTIACW